MAKARGGGQGGQGGHGICRQGAAAWRRWSPWTPGDRSCCQRSCGTLPVVGTCDKLAVVSMRSSGRICCLSLMKVEELAGTVRDILGPVARELSGGGKTMSDVRTSVREHYARTARRREGGVRMRRLGPAACCGPTPFASERLGYGSADLASIPKDADLGLGCGNPTALAGLRSGETVVDLGSGGGIDCFLASRNVGPSGRVIGVDMTPEMIDRARRAAAEGGYGNVEFRLGEIESLPVADAVADAVISNCVVNLSPDKPRVFREAFRV